EQVEFPRPEAADAREPLVHLVKALAIERIDPPLRLRPHAHELRVLQHLEMLRDGGRAHVEPGRDLPGRKLAGRQHLNDALARGVRKGCQNLHATSYKLSLN